MIGIGIIASPLLRYMGDSGKKGGDGKSGTITCASCRNRMGMSMADGGNLLYS